MAGQITHIIAGEDALERAALSSATEGARGAEALGVKALGGAAGYFRLGCQGPDIFYHNQRTMPSGLHYGALAHRRRYGSVVEGFAAALSLDERRADRPAGAYLLGLATHAALDRATHPFIVYFSGWAEQGVPETASRRGYHPFLERVLDMALLRRERGADASAYDVASLMAASDGERGDAGIAALWAAGLRAAYPRAAAEDPLIERRAANALADARYFYAITDPSADAAGTGRERWSAYLEEGEGMRLIALLYPREAPPGLDAANEARAAWEHPAGDGRTSSASYYDLVEEGTAEAARAIAAAMEALRSGDAKGLAAAVGDGCLSVCDPGGAPVAPRLSRPLALGAAMEAEFRRRLAGL